MRVIYVDNHLLVVVKPAGLATQPHGNGGANLTDLAKAWVKGEFRKPGNVFLEPIHRLDKAVSGLVLFARTSKALSRLQQMMRQREIKKTYHARLDTLPEVRCATVEHYLVHDDFRARVVSPDHPAGKWACLSYRISDEGIVEIELQTGRYHQIRAQFAALGTPILGDAKYGSREKWTAIALHHGKLELVHPVTKEPLCFTDQNAQACV